jgi:hypothetical protein
MAHTPIKTPPNAAGGARSTGGAGADRCPTAGKRSARALAPCQGPPHTLPEKAPPPCAPQPPYVSMMILRPVRPASPWGPPMTKRPEGLRWKMVLSSRYFSGTCAGGGGGGGNKYATAGRRAACDHGCGGAYPR